jgi:hypothetical protein
LVPASAASADVTIGSSLAGAADLNLCAASISCTYIQTSVGAPVAASPIDGRVVRWRLKAGSTGGTVKLRVLRRVGPVFTALATSAAETVSSAMNTFTTNLPIKAGDMVGLDNSTGGLYFTSAPAVTLPNVLYFQPAPANGSARTPDSQRTGVELLMNADVAPLAPSPKPAPPATPAPTPKITKLKVRPRRFRAAHSGGSIARLAPIGATVSYALSTDAIVKFRVQRRRRGRHGTRYVKVRGTFTLAGAKGLNKFRFLGRVGDRKLRRGTYRLAGTPSAAGKTGKARRALFRIK